MRRLLTLILAILILSAPLSAEEVLVLKHKAASETVMSNFETSGDRAQWTTVTGSPVLNQDTTGLSMEGSYCAALKSTEAYITYTATADQYFTWYLRRSGTPDASRVCARWKTSGGDQQVYVTFHSTGLIKISSAGGSEVAHATSITSSTGYVKVRINGNVATLWVSSDGTNWGTGVTSTGTWTGTLAHLHFDNDDATATFYFDKLKTSSADISDAR